MNLIARDILLSAGDKYKIYITQNMSQILKKHQYFACTHNILFFTVRNVFTLIRGMSLAVKIFLKCF